MTQTSFLFSAAAWGVVSPDSGLSLSLCLDPNLIPALLRLKLPSEHSEEFVSISENDTVFFLSETLFMLGLKQVDYEKTDMFVTTATLLLNLSPVWSWLDSIPLFLALPQPSEDISLFPLTVSLPIALDSCVFFV